MARDGLQACYDHGIRVLQVSVTCSVKHATADSGRDVYWPGPGPDPLVRLAAFGLYGLAGSRHDFDGVLNIRHQALPAAQGNGSVDWSPTTQAFKAQHNFVQGIGTSQIGDVVWGFLDECEDESEAPEAPLPQLVPNVTMGGRRLDTVNPR